MCSSGVSTFQRIFPALVALSVAISFAGTGVWVIGVGANTTNDANGSPELDTYVPANTVVPGESQEIQMVVTNDGEVHTGTVADRNALTPARNVRATVESDSDAIDVDTGTQALGTITENQPRSSSYRLSVADDIEPGEYDLEVELEYSYTTEIERPSGEIEDRPRTDTQTITVDVDDDATFVVRNTSTSAPVGNSGKLLLEMENIGEQTANDASVRTKSTNTNVVFGQSEFDPVHAGTWKPNETKIVTHDLRIRDQSTVRPYPLQSTVTYDDGDGIEQVDRDVTSSVSPLPGRQFVVRNASTNALVGDRGELFLEIEHVGERTAYDATVHTESVVFGETGVGQAYAGVWEPGAVKTISHDVRIKDESTVRPYPLDTTVSYEGADAITKADDGLLSSVSPRPEQTFTLELSESTLRVDEEGRLHGEITNNGPETVQSVELRAPLEDPNLYPIENTYAVGELEPGETESFELHLDVGNEAEPVEKLLGMTVRYRTEERDQRMNDESDVVVTVDERRDDFHVTSTAREIGVGSSDTVAVEVTNNRDETVTDIEPKLFADDPLSSPDDTAYVPQLEPNETATVIFEVGASAGAVPKTYSTSLDIRYDDADGRSQISDTHRTAITVVETDGGVNPVLVGALLFLLVGILVGLSLWRRE